MFLLMIIHISKSTSFRYLLFKITVIKFVFFPLLLWFLQKIEISLQAQFTVTSLPCLHNRNYEQVLYPLVNFSLLIKK
eukprot:UN24708